MVEVPPVSLSQFRTDAYHIVEAAGAHLWFLILNCKDGAFADKRVRQAANYAVNKEALVNNVLEGTATVAAGPTPAAFNWAVNPDVAPYAYDPEKAKALLAEAGQPNPKITFFVTEGGSGMLDPVAMGTAIQADLAAVGFDVTIQTYEWNAFLDQVNPGISGKADMAEMAWMTNDPDTLPFLGLRTEAFPDKGGFNSGYYSNPEVDDLLNKARISTDQAERATLYKKMQVIVHDDAPWLFVANWKQNAVATAAVQGLTLQPSFLLTLKGVSKA
jgi:peptide/nickel transport system substrate-binding protein